VFAAGEPVVHVVALRQHASALPDRFRFLAHVVTQDARRAVRRPDEVEQDVDRRRLSGPVRAEEAVYLALLDGEIDPFEGRHLTELFTYALKFDGSHTRRFIPAHV